MIGTATTKSGVLTQARTPQTIGSLVLTQGLREIQTVGLPAVVDNGMVVVDGPPGTGKTTSMAWLQQELTCPVAMVTMTFRPAPLELLRMLSESLFGSAGPHVSAHDLRRRIREHLHVWGGVIIVDEVQNARITGMQELRYFHDVTNHGFGLVMVGSGVTATIESAPELPSRIDAWIDFTALGRDQSLDFARNLDPRLAATDEAFLRKHDKLAVAGIPRMWVKTVQWLDRWGHDDGAVDDLLLEDARMFLAHGRSPS